MPQFNKPSFQLQATPQEFLDDLVVEIDRAKTSVAAQFYTFEADAAGLPIAHALLRAQQRGVHVRLMIDDNINFMHNDNYMYRPRLDRKLQRSVVNEWKTTKQLLHQMKQAGIEVKILKPMGAFHTNILRLGLLHTRLLVREHKKLVAIDANNQDGGVSYMGGVNPSDHNASWNDFMVKMRGDMTGLISKELDHTWHGTSTGGITTFTGGKLVTDVPGQPFILPLVEQLIRKATNRVIIESPYLWGSRLIRTLTQAAQRGVNVSVIVPQHNNWPLFTPSAKVRKKLTAGGVHVYRFQDNSGMTHTKALLVDSTSVFGSSNFNEFLARNLTEACIVTDDHTFVGQYEKLLSNHIAQSLKES